MYNIPWYIVILQNQNNVCTKSFTLNLYKEYYKSETFLYELSCNLNKMMYDTETPINLH